MPGVPSRVSISFVIEPRVMWPRARKEVGSNRGFSIGLSASFSRPILSAIRNTFSRYGRDPDPFLLDVLKSSATATLDPTQAQEVDGPITVAGGEVPAVASE